MSKSTNYEIKTTLAIDGEKAFKAAMDDANRSMRVMNADLKAMAAEYDYTDDKQRFFAQRAELVNEKLKQQDAIVEALGRAVKESGEKYGDASAKTDQYRIRLSDATAKMFELRKESEKAQQELEELGRDSARIGRNIENGIGDAAEDTADKLDRMFEKVEKDVEALKSNTEISAFVDLAGFIQGAATSLDDFAESSREYRRSMSFLEQNARTYGLDFSEVKELFFEMASVTGDVDSSVEALSNLMAAGFDAEELIAAVDLLGGAVVRFPDTLKFENLADGLQETLATGSAAGKYAELLERMGVNLDDFNKALEDAKTAEEDQQIALAYLTENGLATTYQSYKDTNDELLKAEEATIRLKDAMSGFGEIVDTVTAPAKLKLADFLIGLTDWIDNTAMKLNPEWHKQQLQNYNPNFADALEAGELDSFGGAWDYVIKNLFPSAEAETLPTTELQGYGFKAMQEVANGATSAAEGDSAIYAAVQTILAEADTQALMDQAKTAGTNLMVSYGNGIAAGMDVPLNNVANMVNQINAMLSQISMPAFGLGWSGITGGNVYLYNQQRNAAKVVSTNIGRGAQTKMLMK